MEVIFENSNAIVGQERKLNPSSLLINRGERVKFTFQVSPGVTTGLTAVFFTKIRNSW